MAEKSGDGIALNDVMLAMDVSDTLRHNQQLVERELDTDARDQALRDKVKHIYASQGIEVSDEVIAEAVKSLRDQRFTYTPPPSGLTTRLWRLYIDRGKWGKRIGAAIAALLAAWGIHWGVVEAPKQRALTREIQQIETGLATARERIRLLRELGERLRQRMESAPQAPPNLADTASRLRRQAIAAMQESDRLLTSASSITPPAALSPDNFTTNKPVLEKRASEQQTLLARAEAQLGQAEENIAFLERLPETPNTLDTLLREVTNIAREPAAHATAESLYQDGIGALKQQDAAKAQVSIESLQKLLATLRQTYTVQVVSRPGKKSGVWRYPDVNREARNYYLIVEAIGPDGKPLEMPIRSEEDGSLKYVKTWGLRVEQRDYERTARDKQDDGIIQNNRVGVKKRGYMQPEYRVATTGAAITEW